MTYVHIHMRIQNNTGKGPQSAMWKQLQNAFSVLEKDFKKLDVEGDGLIDYQELAKVVPLVDKHVRVGLLARLQNAFGFADADKSKTLDFFEFMFMTFQLTQDGSYQQVVKSVDPGTVKLTMMGVYKCYM
jgi:Ca2+-binding EF-hand superfamily protein